MEIRGARGCGGVAGRGATLCPTVSPVAPLSVGVPGEAGRGEAGREAGRGAGRGEAGRGGGIGGEAGRSATSGAIF